MNNEEWKRAYKEGFSEGYAQAKKDMNYLNFPPVYWGTGPAVSVGTIPGRDPKASVSSTQAVPMPGTYGINKPGPDHKIEPFVTGMSVSSSDC